MSVQVKVIYGTKQVADPGYQPGLGSPSAGKPKAVAEALCAAFIPGLEVSFVEPGPLTRDDLKRVHNPQYVDGVLDLKLTNGFGTRAQSVADSLPYTNGAMYDAARLAQADAPTCALVSGFHHACYDGWEGRGLFCTFNGLLAAAAKLVAEDGKKLIAILDCDMHYGNGTDDILMKEHLLAAHVMHTSFGRLFSRPQHAEKYLEWLTLQTVAGGNIYSWLAYHKPDVLLYQAGADVHVNDPLGGVLTTAQMLERDCRVFRIARALKIPVAWNLAGGYQVAADGSIDEVVQLHLNTFRAAVEVYGPAQAN